MNGLQILIVPLGVQSVEALNTISPKGHHCILKTKGVSYVNNVRRTPIGTVEYRCTRCGHFRDVYYCWQCYKEICHACWNAHYWEHERLKAEHSYRDGQG